ncbi:MAG: hypothetical protein AVDCRST_MAG43-1457 [uncultured Thermomicrobiales bacterium]|uniref:Uncharacterized protein n=1 Tax=uncultured Thermomicrobiales bacterium TaxID=1645740 RepID=A0A6J4UR23_9BACT|nr:MAG: hypothetical protein AVDCRST_MAG43-1457 [uncultured Thermomicrobiales bacterium]
MRGIAPDIGGTYSSVLTGAGTCEGQHGIMSAPSTVGVVDEWAMVP